LKEKMNFSRRSLLFSAASVVVARRLKAQNDTTFTAGVKVVNVFATVRDRRGRIVRNLAKDDFSLEEDGRPQTIRYFSQETDLPLTLGLLVDTSGSQRRLVGQERSASYRFLDQVLRENKDRAFVIHFDHDVELLEDLTSSHRKLEAALAELEPPAQPGQRYPGGRGRQWGGGSGTSLYDAILLASDELMRKQSGRKALVLLTDGVDVGSHVGLVRAIESAQRADTLVYSILFADPEGYPGFGGSRRGGARRRGNFPPAGTFPGVDGKKVLQRISNQTGGGFFEVSNNQPIENIYSRLEEELRNQYSLGYTPDHPEGSPRYHRIRVVTKQNDLSLQAREGYYADR
jgi:VWFA-related protein